MAYIFLDLHHLVETILVGVLALSSLLTPEKTMNVTEIQFEKKVDGSVMESEFSCPREDIFNRRIGGINL
jgi:hypothetical protein